jgi:hypothetical protein
MSGDNSAIVRRMHEWGNTLFDHRQSVTPADIRELWSEDGAMIVNGEVKCAGVAALTKHFAEIRLKLRRARVQLPYLALVENGSSVAARYVIDVEHSDGLSDRIHVGAFFEIEASRIKTMNEVVSFERKHIELDRH